MSTFPESKTLTTVEDGIVKPKTEISLPTIIRADELNVKQLEPPFFIVDGMLPTGLTLLASPPKFGKSWLVLDLCISATTGTDFLGRHTNQCGALYLALEDSEARLQSRMRKVLAGREASKDFAIWINAADLDHGLIGQLSQFVDENPQTKLIVIDTFQKVRGEAKRGSNVYAVDYREAGMLKAFADQYKLGLVLVHHTKKAKDDSDSFANISGTSGLTGAADTMIVLERKNRTDARTKISLTGRDVEAQEYMALQDSRSKRWIIQGTAEEIEDQDEEDAYNNDPIVQTIKKLLYQNREGWTGSSSEIISSSRYFRTPIHETPQQLGKAIEKLEDKLYRYDNIICERIDNGSGAKKHRFTYGENPFEE